MTEQHKKSPFENPDEKLWDVKIKDYKIPKRKKTPLEKKVEKETLKKEKDEPRANRHLTRHHLTPKGATKALNKILNEYKDDITYIYALQAYTEDKIEFKGMDILKAVKKGKEFVRFYDKFGSSIVGIDAKKNGTNIALRYDGRGFAWGTGLHVGIHLRGKESEVKKEYEILRKLLKGTTK